MLKSALSQVKSSWAEISLTNTVLSQFIPLTGPLYPSPPNREKGSVIECPESFVLEVEGIVGLLNSASEECHDSSPVTHGSLQIKIY